MPTDDFGITRCDCSGRDDGDATLPYGDDVDAVDNGDGLEDMDFQDTLDLSEGDDALYADEEQATGGYGPPAEGQRPRLQPLLTNPRQAFAGKAPIYRPPSPSPPLEEVVVGLHNIGNTCYINSVVQSLFAVPDFCARVALFDETMEALERFNERQESAAEAAEAAVAKAEVAVEATGQVLYGPARPESLPPPRDDTPPYDRQRPTVGDATPPG